MERQEQRAGTCIEDDLLEVYASGRASSDEERVVEEHLLVCARCVSRVEAEAEVIRTIRAAFPAQEH